MAPHGDADRRQTATAALGRISRSRAFRRLAHKTQVIFDPTSDHLATRLVHSLEVAATAREMAAGFAAGAVDLALLEAIALAHDVGHPPFGHAGEAALARLAADAGLGGFHHASFGVRLLSSLERDGHGEPLVTNDAVLAGVLAHSKGKSGAAIAPGGVASRASLEARIVRLADLASYASGDFEDAQRLGVLSARELPTKVRNVLGGSSEELRASLVNATRAAAREGSLALEPEAALALEELRAVLYERFYEGPPTVTQTQLARRTLHQLWRAFGARLDELLDAVGWRRRERADRQATMRDALDALACMTDRYAVALAARV